MRSPREAFRSFLNRAEDDGWIAGFKWHEADSWPALKKQFKGPPGPGVRRCHKKGIDGLWWALEIEAFDGTSVGLDLELLYDRPILDRPQRVLRKLGISKPPSPKALIEEWSLRESVYQALGEDLGLVNLSQIRRTAPNTYGILIKTGERSVQVRSAWGDQWCLSLGWRSVT
jgi:hypothetical protein